MNEFTFEYRNGSLLRTTNIGNDKGLTIEIIDERLAEIQGCFYEGAQILMEPQTVLDFYDYLGAQIKMLMPSCSIEILECTPIKTKYDDSQISKRLKFKNDRATHHKKFNPKF